LAKAAGYDTDYYDLDVCRWNGTVGDFGGAAAVGGKFFADKAGTKAISLHEFGHNLGLMHSNAFKGDPPSINGPGYSLEYANYWDWMGASGEGGHFVVPTKAQLNWLPREGQRVVRIAFIKRISLSLIRQNATHCVLIKMWSATTGLSSARCTRATSACRTDC
jgi:hypothetical protein